MPLRIDIGPSAERGTPPFALIFFLNVDDGYTLVPPSDGFAVNVTPEALELMRPTDFFGAFAVEYSAVDIKAAVSPSPGTIIVNVEARREVPIAVDDRWEVDEDGELQISVRQLIANDEDGDGDALRVLDITAPSSGILSSHSAAFSQPLPEITGLLEPITHSAWLEGGSPLPAWLQIDPDSGRLHGTPPAGQDVDLVVIVESTGAAPNADPVLTRQDITVEGNLDVVLTYRPEPEFSGPVEFTYTITDDSEGTDTGLVTIHVLPRNDPPVANDDLVSAIEDTPLTIPVRELLDNDHDVDGDPLRIARVVTGRHGTPQLTTTESGAPIVLFTPEPNYDGHAWFEYVVTDDTHGESVGLVSVTISSTNRHPVAHADGYSTLEDTSLVVAVEDLLANDLDPDQDDFTFTDIHATEANGQAFLRPDGRYDLTPRGDYYGPVTFTYTISDGRLLSLETGNLILEVTPVNDPPEAVDDTGYAAGEDTTWVLELSELLANDTDVEGDDLSISELFDPVNGEVNKSGNQAVFIPRANYFGNAGFSYRVTDGNGASDIGFVSLLVEPDSGDLPIPVADAVWAIDEDTSVTISPAELLANDVDPDGDPITFLGVSGSGVRQLANGDILFTPAPNANGRFTREYTITDGMGPAVTGMFSIDVRPLDDPPTARDDQFDTWEDHPLTIPLIALKQNDGDVDGHDVTISSVAQGIGGTATWDGVGNVVFTPAADFFGAASFAYTLTDITGQQDVAVVTVDITPVDDPPIAFDDTATTSSNAPLRIDVTANDSDADDDLDLGSVSLRTLPTSGSLQNHGDGSLTYTPNLGFRGEDRFTYVILDSVGHTSREAEVKITVTSNDTVRPRVTAVYLDSQHWSPVFRDYVDGGFGGTSHGYPLSTSGSSDTLPWYNLDTLHVLFSEDVSIAATDLVFLKTPGFVALGADGQTGYLPTVESFSYADQMATWRFTEPLRTAAIDLVLAGVTDRSDNSLDGGSGQESHRSRLLVLPGDTNNSRTVGVDDLRPIREHQNGLMLNNFTLDYLARADLDGRSSSDPDGMLTIIDVGDLRIARDQQNSLILAPG